MEFTILLKNGMVSLIGQNQIEVLIFINIFLPQSINLGGILIGKTKKTKTLENIEMEVIFRQQRLQSTVF